jgi:hypothetical protein
MDDASIWGRVIKYVVASTLTLYERLHDLSYAAVVVRSRLTSRSTGPRDMSCPRPRRSGIRLGGARRGAWGGATSRLY